MAYYKVRHQCDGPNGKTCNECAFYDSEDYIYNKEVYRKETCAMDHNDRVEESAPACKDFRGN